MSGPSRQRSLKPKGSWGGLCTLGWGRGGVGCGLSSSEEVTRIGATEKRWVSPHIDMTPDALSAGRTSDFRVRGPRRASMKDETRKFTAERCGWRDHAPAVSWVMRSPGLCRGAPGNCGYPRRWEKKAGCHRQSNAERQSLDEGWRDGGRARELGTDGKQPLKAGKGPKILS